MRQAPLGPNHYSEHGEQAGYCWILLPGGKSPFPFHGGDINETVSYLQPTHTPHTHLLGSQGCQQRVTGSPARQSESLIPVSQVRKWVHENLTAIKLTHESWISGAEYLPGACEPRAPSLAPKKGKGKEGKRMRGEGGGRKEGKEKRNKNKTRFHIRQ